MGYVRVRGRVSSLVAPGNRQEVEFIADTGAMWSVVPETVLETLGIRPRGQRRFRLANGQAETFPVGDAYIEVEDIMVGTTVIFGREGAPALLGVTTLEQLGLEVDPVTGKLKPMELMLLLLTSATRSRPTLGATRPPPAAGNTRSATGDR